MSMTIQGYEKLAEALNRAYDRAARGKGHVRHAGADNKPFDQQPIFTIADQVGIGFLTGQTLKKIDESRNLPTKAAMINELLDAIVYLSAAVIYLEESQNDSSQPSLGLGLDTGGTIVYTE